MIEHYENTYLNDARQIFIDLTDLVATSYIVIMYSSVREWAYNVHNAH